MLSVRFTNTPVRGFLNSQFCLKKHFFKEVSAQQFGKFWAEIPDHVYLRHLSTEYRSILSADMPTDNRPISRPILGRYVGRDSADISTDVNGHACRPTPGRYFTATRPTVGRYITDTRRIMCFHIDRVSVDTIGRYVDRQSADISTDTRPICRPRLGRHIDRHQPTRMSADTRPILHRHLADTRPTLRSIGRCLAVVASPVNCDFFSALFC